MSDPANMGSSSYTLPMFSEEIAYLQYLGSKRSLILAASNLGAYEAVLHILQCDDDGLPVYQALEKVQSRFCSKSGLLKRLRVLRNEGLLEERMGRKKSEVHLVVSGQLREELKVALGQKYLEEQLASKSWTP